MNDHSRSKRRSTNPASPAPEAGGAAPAPGADDGRVAEVAVGGDGRAPEVEADDDGLTLDGSTEIGGWLAGAGNGGTATSTPEDDLDSLRISQDFGVDLKLERPAPPIQVRKPAPEWFFRVSPDEDHRFAALVIELKASGEKKPGWGGGETIYLVVGHDLQNRVMADATLFPGLASIRLLVLGVNRQGLPFAWPLKTPRERENDWTTSARDIAFQAQTQWVRLVSDQDANCYKPVPATDQSDKPIYPGGDFRKLVKVAFRDRVISSWDHPVLKRLRGEAK
jgi:hypothetical protein